MLAQCNSDTRIVIQIKVIMNDIVPINAAYKLKTINQMFSKMPKTNQRSFSIDSINKKELVGNIGKKTCG